jgi:hypothetical protein
MTKVERYALIVLMAVSLHLGPFFLQLNFVRFCLFQHLNQFTIVLLQQIVLACEICQLAFEVLIFLGQLFFIFFQILVFSGEFCYFLAQFDVFLLDC